MQPHAGLEPRREQPFCIDDMKFHDESRSHGQHRMQSPHEHHHSDNHSHDDSATDPSAPVPIPSQAPQLPDPLTYQEILAEERMRQKKLESWGIPPIGEDGFLAVVAARFHDQS